ncbi:MAG: glucuronate isomerase, partial [Budvicia sp.]|nr:glucuronate isomerase [Budvicia sp.]
MKPFMNDSFLLSTSAAERLYFDYAAPQPIFDYHCHLPPKDVAENRQFNNLAEIWLAGDHYKWRVLRTAGVDEQLITGNADDYDKYLAWAAVVPKTLGNPIYHWTHLELRRPFGIENIQFGPQNAEKIWHQANELLATPEFSARGIMQQMNVKMVGTTDDPIDSLVHHQAIAKDASFDI